MARLPLKKRKENRRKIEGKRRAAKSSSITQEIQRLEGGGRNKPKPQSKLTEKDQQDIRNEEELTNLLKNKPKGGYSKENTKDPGPGEKREKFVPSKKKTKQKKSEMGKEEWLKKTRNSPAAKSGVFTDDERWAQQQKHRKFKADRAAGKHRKKNLTNAEKLKLRRR